MKNNKISYLKEHNALNMHQAITLIKRAVPHDRPKVAFSELVATKDSSTGLSGKKDALYKCT